MKLKKVTAAVTTSTKVTKTPPPVVRSEKVKSPKAKSAPASFKFQQKMEKLGVALTAGLAWLHRRIRPEVLTSLQKQYTAMNVPKALKAATPVYLRVVAPNADMLRKAYKVADRTYLIDGKIFSPDVSVAPEAWEEIATGRLIPLLKAQGKPGVFYSKPEKAEFAGIFFSTGKGPKDFTTVIYKGSDGQPVLRDVEFKANKFNTEKRGTYVKDLPSVKGLLPVTA